LLKEIASSVERGEKPQVLLLKTWNEKRRLWEVQIITIAPQHRIEEVSYATKAPSTWRSIGQQVLTPEAAVRMGRELIRVASAKEAIIEPLTKYPEFTRYQACIIEIGEILSFLRGLGLQGKRR